MARKLPSLHRKTSAVKIARTSIIAAFALACLALAAGAWVLLGQREAAPAVAYTLLDGRSTSTAAQRGNVMLVNFWATSCTTCVAEMPRIVATHNKFKAQGYRTLAVAMSYDQPSYVTRFVQSRALPFDVAFDQSGAVARAFGDIKLTPTTFLIDKQGRIVKRYLGTPDFAALDKLIGELLAET
jgi:peroxiredoxin